MLQSYHHITERSKYIQEFERQKMFLEFLSKYTFKFKIQIASLTSDSQLMYTNLFACSGIYMTMVMRYRAGTDSEFLCSVCNYPLLQ